MSSIKKPTIVACIPAYNEEKNIAAVIIETKKYVDQILVCDDGSSDLTYLIAEGLGATVIKHEINKGYGSSIKTLFENALKTNASIILTIDADSQHDPNQIPNFIQAFEKQDIDILIGSRFLPGSDTNIPKWRENGIRIINKMANNALDNLSDTQSGFRAYKIDSLRRLRLSDEGMGISTEILLKANEENMKIAEIPITVKYFDDSSTHHPIMHGISVFLGTLKHITSRKPLMFFGIPGSISLAVSSILWFIVFRKYALTNILLTNAALIATLTTLVGLILITTGTILWILIDVINEKIS